MFPFAFEILLVLFLSAIGLYLFAKRRNDYWRKRGIAGPKLVSPFAGNLDQMFGNRPSVFQMREWTKQFGKVYGIQYGWFKALIISDPKMVHEMLVDKFEHFHGRLVAPNDGDTDTNPLINMFAARGKRWKRLRTISTPSFSTTNLKKVMPLMADSIHVTMNLLEKASQSGEPINLLTYFVEMTFDVISRVALGQKESRQFSNDLSEAARNFMLRINNNHFDYLMWILPWTAPRLIKPYLQLTAKWRDDPYEKVVSKLFETVKERKRQKDEGIVEADRRVDFIDLFLASENQQCALESQNGMKFKKTDCMFDRTLRLEEIVLNCFLFLVAGFDTTANSLSIICHNLAMHPDVQEKMREEIESVCQDEEPTYEELSQLKYTEAVLKETLRLCPIASYVVNRVAQENSTLGDLAVEKGTTIFTDAFTLHRDKTIWGPDAEQFRPERWLEKGAISPEAFIVFGGGPRICIGMRLAILEEKMALCHLMRKFTIRKCKQTEPSLNYSGQVVLTPESVTVQLENRQMVE